MENYQMNRSGCRPYNRTCGMMNFSPAPLSQMRRQTSCSEMNCESSDCTRPYKNSGDFIPVKSSYNPSISQTPNCPCTKPVSSKTDNMYEHLKHLTPAMAYVPYQNFTSAYDLDYACLWALFSHSFVNHSVEREVFEDDEKAAFPKMLFFTADQ